MIQGMAAGELGLRMCAVGLRMERGRLSLISIGKGNIGKRRQAAGAGSITTKSICRATRPAVPTIPSLHGNRPYKSICRGGWCYQAFLQIDLSGRL